MKNALRREDAFEASIYDTLGTLRVAFLGKPKVLGDPASTVLAEARRSFAAIRGVGTARLFTGSLPTGPLPAEVMSTEEPSTKREVVVHRQIHSARVTDASEAPADADGLVDVGPGRALCVVTADCVPVLLGDPESGEVAALHAGWRGLAKGIIAVGVELCAQPGRLSAWIGPSIGPCCYEVSEDVATSVQACSGSRVVVGAPSESAADPGGGRNPHLDLVAAARAQLRQAGVVNVRAVNVCTRCDKRWFSYRRDGPGQGRNHAFVWVASG